MCVVWFKPLVYERDPLLAPVLTLLFRPVELQVSVCVCERERMCVCVCV